MHNKGMSYALDGIIKLWRSRALETTQWFSSFSTNIYQPNSDDEKTLDWSFTSVLRINTSYPGSGSLVKYII